MLQVPHAGVCPECRVLVYLKLGAIRTYLDGQGNLVSRSITAITHMITLVIVTTNLLTMSP